MFLYSDEIKRMELIVDDITKLRTELENCRKNSLQIKNLEKQLEKYKKLLISKDKEIKSKKYIVRYKEKIKVKECKVNTMDKPNKFPKLILKDKYKN